MWSRAIIPDLLLLGLALRFIRLDAALWYDEAFSAWLAQLPLERLLEATLGDVHPPGYYVLLWLVNLAVGHSEVALRLPSVLAGGALIIAVYGLARALNLDPTAGRWAALLTALSPFQIYYSQEVRAYALLSLAVTLAAIAVIRRRWGWAVGVSVAALYLHNMAGLFVGSVWLAGWWYHGKPQRFIKPLRYLAVWGLLGAAPAAFFTLHQVGAVGGGYWVPPLDSPGRIIATLDDLLWFAPNNPFIIAGGLCTCFGLVLVGLNWRFVVFDPRGSFAAVAMALPLAVVVVVSVLWQPVLISRVMAPSAPFLYLLLAQAITITARRRVFWLATAGPTAACILAAMVAGPSAREPVNLEMLSSMRQADAIYHANLGSYIVWKYYLPDMPQYVWPQENTLAQTLTTATKEAMAVQQVDFEFFKCARLTTLDGPTVNIRRWWLIYFHNPTTSPAEMAYVAHLERDYPAERVKLLRSDPTVEAWLVRLTPDCDDSLADKQGSHRQIINHRARAQQHKN